MSNYNKILCIFFKHCFLLENAWVEATENEKLLQLRVDNLSKAYKGLIIETFK